jgi:hypothetical protein
MELNELTDKAVDYILDELKDQLFGEAKLTLWEKSFVESITDQWARRRSLSDRQKEILGKIWDKV